MNPIEYLENVHGINADHITYNPDVVKQYDIIRGSSHDTTLLFTYKNIDRCLEPLLNRKSFFKDNEPNWDDVIDIKYEIGNIEIIDDFKTVDLPCGKVRGVEQIVKIPIRCEYILKEAKR